MEHSADPQPTTPADALRVLEEFASRWWRLGRIDAIEAVCAQVPDDALSRWPKAAYWRALAGLMHERGDVLACLEQAHAGFTAASDAHGAAATVDAALVACLLDIGAMDRVNDWLARTPATTLPRAANDDAGGLWMRLGTLAREVLHGEHLPEADLAAAWLRAQLRPLRDALSPQERLIAAQVLVNFHFARQQYAQFDFLANAVEDPALFEAATPLMRGRWLYTIGFAHYQIGGHAKAERAWQQTLALTQPHELPHLRLQTSLALVRLLIDRGRIDEAEALVDAIQPRWGAGRVTQLISLQQMRARLMLMRGESALALATLHEALALADDAELSVPERASCRTDLSQALIALDRLDESARLLAALAHDAAGRDAQVYCCLEDLLAAWRVRTDDPALSRSRLAAGLSAAQRLRYAMFFRLLPALAAELCWLALRWGVEPVFVDEVIRARALPAPAGADARWPWVLWVRMLGGFELRRDGSVQPASGKTQQKPLELLRLLCCERGLALGLPVAMERLWPDVDSTANQRKNLEMTVQRLRRLLGDASLVRVADGRIACDATRVSADVAQRRSLVERLEAVSMRASVEPREAQAANECAELVARIVEFTRGELLPDGAPATWLLAERQRCERETVRAALAAAACFERAGAGLAEQELLLTALRIEPCAEALVRCLMRSHERHGQRADALRTYERLKRDLASQGLEPGAPTTALWRELVGAAGRPGAR